MLSFHLGRRLRLEDCARAQVDRVVENGKSDLCLRLAEGWVYLFSFGAVVFVKVEKAKALVFVDEILAFTDGVGEERPTDDYFIEVHPGTKDRVQFDHLEVSVTTPRKLKLSAFVLAQSTTLEHYEKSVELLLDRASSFTDNMASGGPLSASSNEMVRFIGLGLSTRREIVSNLAILDSPDVAWEDSDLDQLYHGLKTNFELGARYRTLEHKLRLIHESVEVLVDLSNTKRSMILEITVIVLIAVEVLLAFLHWR